VLQFPVQVSLGQKYLVPECSVHAGVTGAGVTVACVSLVLV
jgi:hypothetical protein